MFAGQSKDQMAIFPTRAVSLPDGSTAYSFTMFQSPDMPDGLFESQYRSLQREFVNLEAVFAEPAPSLPSTTRSRCRSMF
jgi:hypothetical protein